MSLCPEFIRVPGLLALTCDLEKAHAGAHHDPIAGAWELVPDPFKLEPMPEPQHLNCKCALPTVDARAIPAWWVAERLEEVFGSTSPRIFHQLER